MQLHVSRHCEEECCSVLRYIVRHRLCSFTCQSSLLNCAAVCCDFVSVDGVLQKVAERCSVLQCVALYCAPSPVFTRECTLFLLHMSHQCVAVCCSALQCLAVCCSVLQCVAVCCSVLQCIMASCTSTVCWLSVVVDRVFSGGGNVLQCVVVHCSLLQCCRPFCYVDREAHSAHCNIQQHTAACCNTLQPTATYYNTLQHTTSLQHIAW